MKTTYPTCLQSFFAAFVFLITCTAQAATVLWTGGGGDNLWHTDTNWSGGVVPGGLDDVIINVPGSPVIVIDAAGVNVRSIQCVESLRVINATLAVAGGSSTFAGPLHLSGGWISADGVGTEVIVAGPTEWMGASCYASSGAELWLTNLTTLVMTNTWTTLQANGENAAIHLSGLTNVVPSESGYSLTIQASGGGLVDLRQLPNLQSYFSVYASSTGSTVDLSGLTALGSLTSVFTLNADGGAILVPNVTSATNVTMSVTADGQINLPLLTAVEAASFSVWGGAKLWLTNVTTLIVSNYSMGFSASGAGSEIHVSNVTNLIGEFVFGNAYLDLSADQGGLVELGRLGHVAGSLRVTSRSAGSVVDVSGLSGVLTGPERGTHSFTADHGVILMPQVTGLKQASVTVYGDGQVGFAPLSLAEGTSFYAYAGAKLWLTNLTELVVGNYWITLSASGAGSVIDLSNVTNIVNEVGYSLNVSAHDGGSVDLHRLPKPTGPFQVSSQSPGSVVDFSGFVGALGTFVGLSAADGGVILMPQVTALNGVSVSVSGDGRVDFGLLTGIEGSAFYAYNGAKIWLTNFTTLTLTNAGLTLQASGSDSAIYLSNVTNIIAGPHVTLSLYASQGGLVDLHRLRNPEAVLNVNAQSAGSIVDLSGITGAFSGLSNSWHSISVSGGSVLMPTVNALERINAYLVGEGSLVTAQLQSLVNSTLSVDNATNDFNQLTNVVNSTLNASTGAKLWLTNVTALYITNGSVSLQASGLDSAIYLPNVTNAVFWDNGYSLSAYASGGGEVDLRRLPNPEGQFSAGSSSSGSVVNLSAFDGTLSGIQLGSLYLNASDNGAILMPDVTALDFVDLSLAGDVQLPLTNWGSITRSRVTVQSGTNDFGNLTNVLGTSFHAISAGKLWLTNLTTVFVTNGTVTLQAWYAESGIYLPNVTNVVIDPGSSLYVDAFQDGYIDLHNVGDISGGTFTVLSRWSGAIVNLSGLTALTPRLSGSSLQASSGGIIILNDTALLISNVGLYFESSPNSIIPAFANPGSDMVLYAHMWNAYLVEARDTRNPDSPWKVYVRVAMTNAIQTIAPLPPADLAFQVTELNAEPPALSILRLANQQTQLILFGVPGQSYQLESKSVLDDAEVWQNGASVSLTNAFRFLPAAPSTEPSRYYRARKL